MSLSSHSAGTLRRIPQQQRGRLRVAGFLRVAATVFTEMGYDRATMSVIAERAHSSIGSLYQFFPNKKSLAQAIRAQYIKGIEQYWLALAEEAGSLDAEELACRLVTLQLEIVKKYPALLALLDVPPTTRTSKQREMIRSRIADVLTAHKCRLPGVTALRLAAVVQQVSRGLLMLYARTDPGQKPAIIEEFKSVLIGYLVPKLRS